MALCATITLYGAQPSRERARLLLENQPQVRRVDASAGLGRLRLFLRSPVSEDELVALLAPSGISGFDFVRA